MEAGRKTEADLTIATCNLPQHEWDITLIQAARSKIQSCASVFYLGDRKQQVKTGNSLFSVINVDSGVPQGSVLESRLFNMYVNDIVCTSK